MVVRERLELSTFRLSSEHSTLSYLTKIKSRSQRNALKRILGQRRWISLTQALHPPTGNLFLIVTQPLRLST